MKFTVIGHWGAYPEANEATSGYLLEHDGFTLLIDCGSGVLSQLQNYVSIGELDAVILSHYHHDHIADIGPLQYARLTGTQLGNITKPLLLYGHTYDQTAFAKLAKEPYVKAVAYNENETVTIGPFSISFIRTLHPATCFAMRIKQGNNVIAYSADSAFFPELASFVQDADLFVCESSFYARQDATQYGHMNCIDAATIARDGNVKQLLLTHHPHFGDQEELVLQARKYFRGITENASPGWTKEFN